MLNVLAPSRSRPRSPPGTWQTILSPNISPSRPHPNTHAREKPMPVNAVCAEKMEIDMRLKPKTY